jgi:diguanylate cyclase (GGDEF)-like protein/PAS domain S-box-containing protein
MEGNPKQSRRIPRQLSLLILAAVALSLAISLSILLLSLHREQTRQQVEFREDIVFFSSQVEREAMVFRDSIYRYREQPLPIIRSEVQQSFDILWSRIHFMGKGDFGKVYLTLPGAEAALDDFGAMLIQLDALVTGLSEDRVHTTEQILEKLRETIALMHTMANRSSAYSLHLAENKRNRFKQLYVEALLLLMGATLAAGILVWLILRQQKTLNLLAGRLEQQVQDQSVDLRMSRQKLLLLSQAIEQSPVSVIICDQEGRIEYVNAQFERISGYPADEVLGKKPGMFKSDKTSADTYTDIWQALRVGREWRGELCNKKKNGELYWEQVSISPIFDEHSGSTRYLAVKEDITQRKKYEEELFRQANFDSLTQLPNRALALDRLSQAISRTKRKLELVGLLFLDLDNFKQVNDTLGHEGGDLLLKEAAGRLAGCLRECDTAARFGGDEFIAILSELKSRDDAQFIVERIVAAFARPFDILGTSMFATASVGISFAPEDGEDAALLLKNADSAMYLAKTAGKSGYRVFGGNGDTCSRQTEDEKGQQA